MSRRIEKVNEMLRERLSQVVLRGLKDPRIHPMTTITEVSVSPDLSSARVYVSVLGGAEDRAKTVEGLQSASGFLHRELDSLALRHVPRLTFVPDDTLERADRIERLIKQVIDDAAPAP
ncbi:MAG: 30S ribosome-binding factor RbfA [Chloroflexi bacterium]|nr:30S ribosome-binding factor RbfA [Chloroflexota bacterium]